VELELALDSGVPVDAAHAVLSDGLRHAFGPRVVDRVGEALAEEDRDPGDLAVLLADDGLAGRVLARLSERLGADDGPEPDADLVWSSVSEAGGRDALRRAKRRRAVNARLAEVLPRRRRIAGERAVRA
jgi:hypothetical protein